MKHSFAVCAYKQSPYLKECLDSLMAQEGCESEVFIATSTPSDWLDGIASSYGIPVHVNTGEHGIGQDWNFAVSQAGCDYVTIAHQDDIYLPRYAVTATEMLGRTTSSLIFFCDYGELRDGKQVDDNHILEVKRRMLRPLADGKNASSITARRRILSMGSAICCPSVTLNRSSCGVSPYRTHMKCSLDWDTWENLSKLDGEFYYSSSLLMYHRIHEDSATTALIENDTRTEEDREMLGRFWPSPVASVINHFYSKSEGSNEL
ncbi:MAG: glycosyltransferase family A protein [Atopobiaceae bacterium]|jgi:glycosyltransferase involved in cell wall biosynthesis|nr:glycosyltransferase family 2 protein [Atopobiaceae bacterium]MCH4214315.1 glycosyltransferase family 2 protein [Atopobiaceae bacterium]MCH4276140.1 glycosyltransferase family 2 protein [Atopobiaceae bacterium]MCI1227341.1 glycosyltransferase family 2 protein [Atopobiaceae bacterium]MCI1259840.1 glycosyltransferase family 2 protein [Atopobiaceae bacterium]